MELELDNSSVLDAADEQTITLPADIKLYSRWERFLDWILGCPLHAWSFPIHSRWMWYPHPYDTHQTCNKCGKSRFYRFNGERVYSGPLFKRVIDSERTT